MKGDGRVRLMGNVRREPESDDHALTFDDVSPRAIEHLKLEIEKVNWFSTYRVHHRVANSFAKAARICSATPRISTARSAVKG